MKILKNFIIISFFLVFLSCQSTPKLEVPYNADLVKDPILVEAINRATIETIQEDKKLSLYHYGVTSLEGIEQLQYIQTLYIGSHYIEDLSPIGKLLKLKELNLSIKNIDDLDLNALKEALPKCNITVTDYEPLYIGEIEFSDPGMEKAIIEYYKTKQQIGRKKRSAQTYFSVRSGREPRYTLTLEDIVDVKLELTGVTKLQGLELLPNLERLEIFEQEISDLDTINDMTTLKNVVISIRGIEDVSDLKESRPDVKFIAIDLPLLVEEVIEDEELKKIIETQYEDVASHIKMERVGSLIINDKVASLSGLQHAISLVSFKMENSAIVDLAPLSGCARLEDAVFDSCSITDLSPFKDGLIYLHRIEIYNNKGDIDFSPLQGRSLEALIVKDSNISEIDGLKNIAVSTLDLSGNNISDISNLSSLSFVTSINLKSNNITDISSLSSFNNLLSLDISSNNIGDNGLYHLPVLLQTLKIENNNINSYEGLVRLPKLGIVNISGNPTTTLKDDVLKKLQARGVLIIGLTKN